LELSAIRRAEVSVAKTRVYELARELGRESKDVLSRAQELGIEVKTASSGLDEDAAALVRLSYDGEKPSVVEEPSIAEEPPAVSSEPAKDEDGDSEPSDDEDELSEATVAMTRRRSFSSSRALRCTIWPG